MSPPSAEHILLESDAREVPDLRAARKSHAQVCLRSRLRRCSTDLAIIDYYYLAVRRQRARSQEAEYVIDLRFADPALGKSRHVASRWLIATLALATLFAACAWRIAVAAAPWWQHGWLPYCGVLLTFTLAAGFVCAYRTTETITLRSVHGRATMLTVVGGLGTFRAARAFTDKLAAHIRASARARRSSRAEHLRDEMREHFRLKEAGVIADAEYEASKSRILGQHAPKA